MAVTYIDVQALAAEFASLGQDRIDPFLDRARRRVSSAWWATLYDDAVLYLAAHLLALAERGTTGGAVLSETAGPLSRTYSVGGSTPAQYAGTSWGLEYWHMIQSRRYNAITTSNG